jgi:putative tryptophan/tyrosine transport system substrate-binding protein
LAILLASCTRCAERAKLQQALLIGAAAVPCRLGISVIASRQYRHGVSIGFARDPHGALILTNSPAALRHREMIIGLAARHKLPAVYPYRFFATEGGLVSYGPDTIEPYRRAAGYVDRILKGEKPSDLPVQAPTKYELVINMKTAKGLGLDVPPTLLARADEVIE